MNKKGFTLIELIITMGIVGVVAALVAPGFMINNRNAANASKLSATVSDLENAFSSMTAKGQAMDLYETEAWQEMGGSFTGTTSDSSVDKVITKLAEYINIMPNQDYKNAANFYSGIKTYDIAADGGKGNTHSFSSGNGSQGRALSLKSGAVVFAYLVDNSYDDIDDEQEDVKKIVEAGGSLKSVAGELMIDVNGKAAPNTIGRDIFYFYLGSDGILYPAGGRDFAIYQKAIANSGSENDIWSVSNSSTACTDTVKANGGWGCTARLAENGFKVNY